jgi:hypothetical protein
MLLSESYEGFHLHSSLAKIRFIMHASHICILGNNTVLWHCYSLPQKTRVCDLRDVSKVSVHPTQERVVGLVLNDRQSHTRRFLCFKLSRKANMKVA